MRGDTFQGNVDRHRTLDVYLCHFSTWVWAEIFLSPTSRSAQYRRHDRRRLQQRSAHTLWATSLIAE